MFFDELFVKLIPWGLPIFFLCSFLVSVKPKSNQGGEQKPAKGGKPAPTAPTPPPATATPKVSEDDMTSG